ncbi:MAG TPA: outer membrane beta-barrel protein [Bryobacteraceae bacterium]|nr:outer membrane beta-barrel protein [Bryobacteraceae bacterium]
MLRFTFASFLLLGFSCAAWAQSFEGSVNVGESLQSNASLGEIAGNVLTGADGVSKYKLDNGFNIAFRVTLNTWKFFGHEVGYAYNRTHLNLDAFDPTGASQGSESLGGMAVHQGFYDFLAYATPEGSTIRPFGAVGVHYSNYVAPGSSAQYGQGDNKFGFNYGGGVKIRVKGPLGVRFDVHQFTNGKPFGLTGASGWIRQTEISAGVAWML